MNPYADSADRYWSAGWRGILPLPYKAKKNPPAGFTGSTGTDPAYPDIAVWVQEGPNNICLRMPDSVIGIDVDAYGDKAGALTLEGRERDWGPLPPTWRSTSRDDGVSGIRLFRIPVGLKWPGEVGPGIETVRRDHRYVVCWPSIHPETNAVYRWIGPDGLVAAGHLPDPDQLPFLPDRWVEGLTGGESATEVRRNTLAEDAAMLWAAKLPDAATPTPCKRMDTARLAAVTDLRDHSAHDTALAGIARLLRLGDEGHTGAVTAIVELRKAFIAEATRTERKILGKAVRTVSEAEYEWRQMLVSGVNFVSADPLNMPACDCDGAFTTAFVEGANAPAAPATAAATTQPSPSVFPQLVDGATFVLSAPEQPPAVWGFGDQVIWAEGESLMIVGPPGVGKTTLVGQVVRGRLTGEDPVLGFGITPTRSRVLYLAMDRPSQIARSLRRHFTEDDRGLLAERLRVWQGPPPSDVAKNTQVLVSLVKLADADTLVVDSVKDAAIGLSSDEVGAAYNQARQYVLAAGAQVVELHHIVKRGPNGAKPTQLADVYGSTWITSGAGSVVLLWGQAGDLVVELTHLKQPVSDVGPLHIEHDHDAGISTVFHGDSGEHTPLEVLLKANRRNGLTAGQAAQSVFGKDDPDANERRRAKRKLKELVERGVAREHLIPGKPSVWYFVDPTTDPTTPDHGGAHGGDHDPTTPDHSPTNDPTTPDREDPTTPTPFIKGGLGGGHPADEVRYCDCGNELRHAASRICQECADKRLAGGGL
jgi:hypothetical protein